MTAGRRSLVLALLLSSIPLAGCRGRNNELLENELRAKDNLYREALTELKRIESQNETLQREVEAFRQLPPGAVPPPEIASNTFGLRRITLGRGTGGYDNDNLPGDEALLVVIEPRDGDDHVVKVPGSLHVTAIEINREGLKHPLCWWTLTPDQLRPFWKQGLLSTGYAVVMPWTVFPRCENVRVVAQFKLSDGRMFEADKDVKVRLLPFAPAPSLPPGPVMPPPTPPTTPWTVPAPTMLPPAGPVSPFVTPSAGREAPLQWAPAPLTDAVDLRPPLPLAPPTPTGPIVFPND